MEQMFFVVSACRESLLFVIPAEAGTHSFEIASGLLTRLPVFVCSPSRRHVQRLFLRGCPLKYTLVSRRTGGAGMTVAMALW